MEAGSLERHLVLLPKDLDGRDLSQHDGIYQDLIKITDLINNSDNSEGICIPIDSSAITDDQHIHELIKAYDRAQGMLLFDDGSILEPIKGKSRILRVPTDYMLEAEQFINSDGDAVVVMRAEKKAKMKDYPEMEERMRTGGRIALRGLGAFGLAFIGLNVAGAEGFHRFISPWGVVMGGGVGLFMIGGRMVLSQDHYFIEKNRSYYRTIDEETETIPEDSSQENETASIAS